MRTRCAGSSPAPAAARTGSTGHATVEAMIAGQVMHASARLGAALLRQSAGRLPRDRKASAAYGKWCSPSAGRPGPADAACRRRAPFPVDPAAWLARATAASHVQGQGKRRIDILREAEQRFPMTPDLAGDACRPCLHQLDRRDAGSRKLAEASPRRFDPDEPSALLVDARYRAICVQRISDGALATLQHAAEVAPGADAV